ncbi:MAG: hypothetical protein JW742_00980 [Candidatus Aminicenantes bacterium]|nr:hypothetical protein [Candidatus Aminicenantes bacterium]
MKKTLGLILVSAALFAAACRKPDGAAAPSPTEPIAAFPEPVRYDIRIDADTEAGTIAGDCALRIRNAAGAPIPVVPLNLYRLMEVAEVSDASGARLAFSQGVRSFEDWRELQVNQIRVGLRPPLAPGEETTLRIKYGGPLLGYAEAMRYVKDHVGRDLTLIRTDSFAYPQVGVPSWRTNRAAGLKDFDFAVALTVPSSLVVAGAGRLVSRDEKDGRTTYVYESKVPSWRIDLAAAAYTVLEGEDGRFRIFAFPEDAEGAQALLDSLTVTLALYTEWFGPLGGFPGLTVIEIPAGYGSQADRAAIIQEADAFKDPARRYTFYHELSHLWNVPAKDPLPPRFESEGLAMFLQHLVQEKLEAKAGAVGEAAAGSLSRLAKNFGEHPDWAKAAMIDYGEKDLTDLSYRMGQILFYLLYEKLGERSFLETIRSFDQAYRTSGATARQFVAHVKKQAGVNLDRIFEDWVFTPRAAEVVAAGISLEELRRRYL